MTAKKKALLPGEGKKGHILNTLLFYKTFLSLTTQINFPQIYFPYLTRGLKWE